MGEADWDPLPPETLEPPVDRERLRKEAEARAAEEEAERKLREILAGAAPARDSKPVTKAVARLAEKQDRKEAAARAPFAEDARHRTSFLQAEDVPLEPTYDEGRDPREDEAWFRRLPADVQQRYRERWQWERRRFDPHKQQTRRRLGRSVVEGIGVFFAVWLLQGILLPGSFPRLLTLLVAGAVSGALWQLTNADRFRHALIGVFVYFVVHLSLLAAIARGMAFGVIPVMYGAVVVGFVSAYRGFRLELRRAEGTW